MKKIRIRVKKILAVIFLSMLIGICSPWLSKYVLMGIGILQMMVFLVNGYKLHEEWNSLKWLFTTKQARLYANKYWIKGYIIYVILSPLTAIELYMFSRAFIKYLIYISLCSFQKISYIIEQINSIWIFVAIVIFGLTTEIFLVSTSFDSLENFHQQFIKKKSIV